MTFDSTQLDDNNNKCFWIYYLILLFIPSLAFIYDVTLILFLMGWGEISNWSCVETSSIMKRLTLLICSIAITVGLCLDVATTQKEKNYFQSLKIVIPVISIIVSAIGSYFLYLSRCEHLIGNSIQFPKNCLKDKVIFITGANTGIGKETVQQLLELGAKTVIMGCRNEGKARTAVKEIESSFTNKKKSSTAQIQKNQLIFIQIDLADFESIKKAVKAFEEMNLPLHILINNAGVMFDKKQITKNGNEMCLQSNHLGHFLLTLLLLPKLLNKNDDRNDNSTEGNTEVSGRIINLTSTTYKLINSPIDFNDIQCNKRKYTLFSQYALTKVCNILFTKGLVNRYGGDSSSLIDNNKIILSYAVNPGIVRTDVTRNMPFLLRFPNMIFGFLVCFYQKTPRQGAFTSIYAAACGYSKSDAGSNSENKDNSNHELPLPKNGSYLTNCQAQEIINENVINDNEAKLLWEISEQLVGWDNDNNKSDANKSGSKEK